MIRDIATLVGYRELLWMWTMRNVKVRYKQSLLGATWAVLQPLTLMVVFSLIFSYFVRVPTEGIPYPIFSYTSLLPWTFFASAIALAVPSLINNMNLVSKVYFPREIFPISAVGSSFIDFLVAGLVFLGMLAYFQIPIRITFLAYPLLLAIQIILTFGIVLLASAVIIFYRDIRFVVPLGLQIWMYLTPIIYPIALVPERIRTLYLVLNPMAVLVESYRDVTLRGSWPDWGLVAIATLISVVLFVIGYLTFKRLEWQFADII